ncbi:hypothetical protein HDU85_002839 [Gaertneriomyces sp. JEL0708]|nr:hypothetical protein HDU85_002839 [Gaertneriomyces sp. JEL0708]
MTGALGHTDRRVTAITNSSTQEADERESRKRKRVLADVLDVISERNLWKVVKRVKLTADGVELGFVDG